MTQALLDLDQEIETQVAAQLPEIVCRLLDRLQATPAGQKTGWRFWCQKHNEYLRNYTTAAIALHRANRRLRNMWRAQDLSTLIDTTEAEKTRRAARAIYHGATCTCFLEP